MKRLFSILCTALVLGAASASASVTIGIQVGDVSNSNGSAIAAGTIGIIVVDSSGNGFAGSNGASYAGIVGTTLSVGNLLNGSGDDKILAVVQASNPGNQFGVGKMGFDTTLNISSYGSGVDANDAIAIYWFSGVTTVGATLTAGQAELGFYTNPSIDGPSGADIGWALPTDGATVNLGAITTTLGGGVNPASLTSTNLVPEPGRATLLSFALLGLIMRRRR